MIVARIIRVVLVCLLPMASACAQRLTLYSADGEKLEGKWRQARNDGGLVQVVDSAGETLVGAFTPISRRIFFRDYEKVFGTGSIAADGPDVSAFGNAFAGMVGGSNTLLDIAYGEDFNPTSEKSHHSVAGPLFYWIAKLEGDKRTTMQCFFIGSAYTGHGLGRCRRAAGKDYTLEF